MTQKARIIVRFKGL